MSEKIITTEQLKQLYMTRQSCRAFADKPVTKAQITSICDLARLAPSACDFQPWQVYAATGAKLPLVKELLKKHGKAPFVDGARAMLAIAEDPRTARGERPQVEYFTASDAGEFTAHLLLAAKAEGLDTCILGWYNDGEIKDALGMPKEVSVPFIIALGYAAEEEIRPKKRKSLDELLFFTD